MIPIGPTAIAASPTCSGAWIIERTPNPADGGNWLADVTAISPTDAWAVGGAEYSTESMPLAIHWDGAAWSHVPTPPFRTGHASLRSVSATSADDVWAAMGGLSRTQVLHWDGIQWHKTQNPDPRAVDSIDAVHAIDRDDVWAVGGKLRRGVVRAYALHWNGQEWTKVDTSRALDAASLDAVDASGPNDVWAVGSRNGDPFSMHWNGRRFKPVVLPPLGDDIEHMSGVATPAAGEALAIGVERSDTPKSGARAIGARRTAGAWTAIEMPNPSTPEFEQQLNVFSDISAVSPADAWAVGYHGAYNYLGHGRSPRETLIAGWNGTSWSSVETPNREAAENELAGVHALSGGDVWAVGRSSQPGGDNQSTLVLHRC
jgi:hypothetical protein